jgi:hypothetical protein
MALVVLLKGVNVGGARAFRPTKFVEQLRHLDAINVGATGVFVIPRRADRTRLRAEIAAKLPFEAEIVVCDFKELVGLLQHPAFEGHRLGPDEVRFVSVLSRRPRSAPSLPLRMPSQGRWLLKLIACHGRFVLGVYRRHMKVIGYLGAVERIFGSTATTRSFSTLEAIAKTLDRDAS